MRSRAVLITVLSSLLPAGLHAQSSAEPTRVYVTDSDSWETQGGWAATKDGGAGRTAGGARPQTVEIMKTFRERCPSITVTSQKARAQYVVLLDHEGGKGLARKDTKIAVFNGEGDLLHAGSTRSVGNAVKDACDAITADQR